MLWMTSVANSLSPPLALLLPLCFSSLFFKLYETLQLTIRISSCCLLFVSNFLISYYVIDDGLTVVTLMAHSLGE